MKLPMNLWILDLILLERWYVPAFSCCLKLSIVIFSVLLKINLW
nr:MAG TPA_asm: hypothetical protein [Caudoviricetes sp.]